MRAERAKLVAAASPITKTRVTDDVKYDKHYRDDPAACGAPFAEFEAFCGEVEAGSVLDRSGDEAGYSGAARPESTRVDQRPSANPRQQGKNDKTPTGDADEGPVKRKAQAD